MTRLTFAALTLLASVLIPPHHAKNMRYTLRHKWFVLRAGLRLHVPIWRLIIHDWTKFTPAEWGPYARFFFTGAKSTKNGGAEKVATAEFDRAWNHHQKKNDHHWEFWLRIGKKGELLALPMPDTARREMLADWKGAGLARNMPDTAGWYKSNRDNMILHEDTRAWIEKQLGLSD